eukprot:2201530-Amphidinium_carterae.2
MEAAGKRVVNDDTSVWSFHPSRGLRARLHRKSPGSLVNLGRRKQPGARSGLSTVSELRGHQNFGKSQKSLTAWATTSKLWYSVWDHEHHEQQLQGSPPRQLPGLPWESSKVVLPSSTACRVWWALTQWSWQA